MHTHNGTTITPNRPFTLDGKQYPANWLTLASADDLTAAGIVYAPDPLPPLVDLRAAKLREIEVARDAACLLDVTALDTQWQADERSQKLLGDAITLAGAGLPLPAVWRDAHNNNLPITSSAQLLAIAGAMATQTQAAYAKSWALKAQVDAAADAATVAAVVW